MEIEKINDDYQDFSGRAGDRASQVAWAFIAMQTGVLVAGKLYDGYVTASVMAIVFLLLSAMQSLWQTVAIWLFKQQTIRSQKQWKQLTDEEFKLPEDYPNWIGFGAWVFYLLKMLVIVCAVIYFVQSFIA